MECNAIIVHCVMAQSSLLVNFEHNFAPLTKLLAALTSEETKITAESAENSRISCQMGDS